MSPHAETLDSLEATVKSILLNIGSAFNVSANNTSDRFEQTRSRLRSAVPSHIDDFHAALDVLEGDLIRATAVISRDLVVLQAKSNDPDAHIENGSESPIDAKDGLEVPRPSGSLETTDGVDIGSDAIMIDASLDGAEANAAENGKPLTENVANELPEGLIPNPSPAPKTRKLASGDEGRESVQAHHIDNKGSSDSAQSLDVVKKADEVEVRPSVLPEPSKDDATDRSVPVAAADSRDGRDLLKRGADEDSTGANAVNNDAMMDTKQADASPSAGFGSLLSGLDMYANDPNGDPLSGIEGFTDMSTSNTYNENSNDQFKGGGFGHCSDFPSDTFGGNNMANEFTQNSEGLDDLLSLDEGNNTTTEGGGGGLDLFDEDFFNLGGN